MSEPERERRPDLPQDRDQHLRRTTSARRTVVAAGTVGALGAAIAIGVHQVSGTAPTVNGTQSGVTQRSDGESGTQAARGFGDDEGSDDGGSEDGGRQPLVRNQQPPPGGGQLATPGNGGPAQGSTSGS